MGNGVILASSISGSLDAKNIATSVLAKALDISNLASLCEPVMVPELTATIPVQAIGAYSGFDLKEWENSPIATGDYGYVSFDLKKDRVKLAVSDEARYKSKAGDPLELQKRGAAQRLAYMLDGRVIDALETSPQTGAASAVWSTATNNPLKDLATAVAALRPFKADFCIMPSAVWAAFVGNDYTSKFVTGAPEKMGGVITRIPGLELDVYVCDNNITAKSTIVGARGCPAAALGQGPVKVRVDDVMDGGEIYQIDVYRQVLAPILKNSSSLNMGAYVLTSCIA